MSGAVDITVEPGKVRRGSMEPAGVVDGRGVQQVDVGHGGHESHGGHGSHDGHGSHGDHGDHAAMFKRKFWLSFALTIPVVLYSHMLMELTGWMAPAFPGSRWLPPVLGTAVFLYGGPVFLSSGWSELKSRAPGMMLLISMGLLVAFGASAATTLGWLDVDLWPELATLVTIMLLGHWIEMRSLGQAQGALSALASLLPDEAERVTDRGIETVAPGDLIPGNVVLVRSGGRVPADGVIVAGRAELDESMVTGESRPVAKDEENGWSPVPSQPIRRSGFGWRRSVSRPPWPVSSGWLLRPRPPAPGPRHWPTGRPRCSSTSPWFPGRRRFWSGGR